MRRDGENAAEVFWEFLGDRIDGVSIFKQSLVFRVSPFSCVYLSLINNGIIVLNKLCDDIGFIIYYYISISL